MKANCGAARPKRHQRIGLRPEGRKGSGAQIGDVHVDAGLHVVKQIPADMVGVFVDYEIIATVPAPVGDEGPIPISDLKVEAAREPKAVVVEVNPSDAVAVERAEMFKMALLEGVIDMETPVGRSIVAVPVVVAHMLRVIDKAVLLMLLFPFEVLRVGFRRRGRDATLVGAKRILMVLLAGLGRLSARLDGQNGIRATS